LGLNKFDTGHIIIKQEPSRRRDWGEKKVRDIRTSSVVSEAAGSHARTTVVGAKGKVEKCGGKHGGSGRSVQRVTKDRDEERASPRGGDKSEMIRVELGGKSEAYLWSTHCFGGVK